MSVLDRLRDRRDGYDEYDDDDDYGGGDRRRRLVAIGMLVVAAVAAVTVGPRIVSAISDRLHDDERTATTDSVPSPSSALVASEPPVPPPSTATSTTSATSASTIPASTTTSPPVTLVALQTVPPVRDVIIRVDGVAMATDGLGQLAVVGLDATSTIEVVGRDAVPALQQVEFTGWSDGSTAALRTVGELTGPVAQIGVAVSSRVVVDVVTPDGSSKDGAQVEMMSDLGPVDVVAGTATWVVASRAVPAAGGLAVQQIVYVPTTVTLTDGSVRPAVEQALTPTPEAMWTVAVDRA